MKTMGFIGFVFCFLFISALSAQEIKPKQNEDGIYIVAEVFPVFPGGEEALRNYLIQQIKYPEQAKKDSITGKVYISFVLGETGKVISTKVVRGVDPLLDQEAVRVVAGMPDWTPGLVDGKPVKVMFTVPIAFALK